VASIEQTRPPAEAATESGTGGAAAPLERPGRARYMRYFNGPMRVILGLPFPTPLSGSLMLLHFTGRRTGKAYRQPVSYVRDGDTLLTPGGGKWKLNLREGRPIRIRLRGRDIYARPEFIGDARGVERLLHRMAAINPRVTSFVPLTGDDGSIDRRKVENAVRYGFAVVRWHLENGTDKKPGQ
jgi:endonuclease YncB( thermonuclease family)